MTICIGLLCEKGKIAVAISDRMLTGADVEYEHPEVKMVRVANNCIALTAGSAVAHIDLCRNVTAAIGSKANPSVSQVLKGIKNEFALLRSEKLEEQYFIPRGFDINWFRQNQKLLDADVIFRLDSLLEDFTLDLEVILVGADTSGAHIYHIYNPGTSDCYDSIGFSSIGVGQHHAAMVFIDNQYTPVLSLKKALYIGYKAKKRAEVAPGVGPTTDINIIEMDRGVKVLQQESMKELEKIYEMELQASKVEQIETSLQNLILRYQ